VSQATHAADGSSGEPLVIVFGYPDGMLPNAFFRAYKRVKRATRRAGYHVSIALQPLTSLPARVDVLIVEPSDGSRAVSSSVEGEVVSAHADEVQAEIDRVIERLVADGRLIHAPVPSRAIAVHRGFRAVTERARLAE